MSQVSSRCRRCRINAAGVASVPHVSHRCHRRRIGAAGVATRHGFIAVLRRALATNRGVAPRLSPCCVVAWICFASRCAAPLCCATSSWSAQCGAVFCRGTLPRGFVSPLRHIAAPLCVVASRRDVALPPCSATRRVDATPRHDAAVPCSATEWCRATERADARARKRCRGAARQ